MAQEIETDEASVSVVLQIGLRVHLRLVPAESWGAALLLFTGSGSHIDALGKRAHALGRRFTQAGIDTAELSAKTELSTKSEEEVYGSLGLSWIPPEMREGRGEVELAAEGSIPTLVRVADLRGDIHMHSTWSDGRASLEEMVSACASKKHEYMAITDHSKALAMVQGLDSVRLRQQWAEVDRIQGAHPEIRILKGMEVDILKDGDTGS